MHSGGMKFKQQGREEQAQPDGTDVSCQIYQSGARLFSLYVAYKLSLVILYHIHKFNKSVTYSYL